MRDLLPNIHRTDRQRHRTANHIQTPFRRRRILHRLPSTDPLNMLRRNIPIVLRQKLQQTPNRRPANIIRQTTLSIDRVVLHSVKNPVHPDQWTQTGHDDDGAVVDEMAEIGRGEVLFQVVGEVLHEGGSEGTCALEFGQVHRVSHCENLVVVAFDSSYSSLEKKQGIVKIGAYLTFKT